MNEQRRDGKGTRSTNNRRGLEMLLFLVVSVIGIYALGNGLTGLFEPGKGIDLLWLAVAVAAMMILFAQMGRVHDTWPRRLDAQEVAAKAPLAQSEERERRST